MINQQVLERCKKLLNLAGSTNFEAEMRVALQKLDELMAEHEIDLNTVKEHGESILVELFEEEADQFSGTYPWLRMIAAAIQIYRGVDTIYYRRGNHMHLCFVSTSAQDASICVALYKNIVDAMHAGARKHRPDNLTRSSQWNWTRSYRIGFASGVHRLVNEVLESRKTVHETYSLAIIDKYALIKKTIDDTRTDLTRKKRRPVRSSSIGADAYDVGVEEGRKAPIHIGEIDA